MNELDEIKINNPESLSILAPNKGSKIKHLMFKSPEEGKKITIPLCGLAEKGIIVTYNLNGVTCKYCNRVISLLLQVDSYEEARNTVTKPDGVTELDEILFGLNEDEFDVLTIGESKEIFWANILRFM